MVSGKSLESTDARDRDRDLLGTSEIAIAKLALEVCSPTICKTKVCDTTRGTVAGSDFYKVFPGLEIREIDFLIPMGGDDVA
jgi:hypothetical protein